MKIALVNPNDMVYRYGSGDPTAVGGAERYQWLLARALARHGWSTVVGVRSVLARGERVDIDGVKFIGIGSGQFFKEFYRFLASERPEWCFWYGSTHLLGPAVAIGALTGTRSLFAAQFDLDVRPAEALSERRRFWPLYAWGLAGCSKIVLQHRGQYAELPSRWHRKAYVIPGVVAVPERFKPHAERDPYVAWVGVLRQPKRPDLVIEIARRCPSVRFVVCGGSSGHRSPPGYSERMIEELRRVPNIDYLGQVAPGRAIEIIGDAALLLSTSDGEGFPSVFLEAWAHGTPVVSLVVDPDQLIARQEIGVMCEGAEAAGGSIRELVGSVEQRHQMAVRAHEYAVRTHSGGAVAASLERALRTGSAPALQPSAGEECL
jgi:glycosyltransferase involved in cell wall biosynthesis